MDESSGKKRRRAIKLIVTVLAMYLICFTPSNLLLVVHYFLIKTRGQSHVYALYIVALCLSTLNSCIDPFVYYFISQANHHDSPSFAPPHPQDPPVVPDVPEDSGNLWERPSFRQAKVPAPPGGCT